MPLPTELPTWEIRPTADGHFHWAVASASEVSSLPPAPPPKTLPVVDDSDRGTRIPSLADLLMLGNSSYPSLKHDRGFMLSFWLSVNPFRFDFSFQISAHTQIPVGVEDDHADGGGLPIFRTASGRSVFASESSINRARSVLGEVDGYNRGEVIYS